MMGIGEATHEIMQKVDRLIGSSPETMIGRYHPRWGWHDNHREHDRTAKYLPALQQVRIEYLGMVAALIGANARRRALQLGMGECYASHEALGILFNHVVTIDRGVSARDDSYGPGGDTHSPEMQEFAKTWGPYDFLFIDAGHTRYDVALDYGDYSPLVRKGGIIAFHDAIKRPGYEAEVRVWEFLQKFPDAYMIGTEVGIAWMAQP